MHSHQERCHHSWSIFDRLSLSRQTWRHRGDIATTNWSLQSLQFTLMPPVLLWDLRPQQTSVFEENFTFCVVFKMQQPKFCSGHLHGPMSSNRFLRGTKWPCDCLMSFVPIPTLCDLLRGSYDPRNAQNSNDFYGWLSGGTQGGESKRWHRNCHNLMGVSFWRIWGKQQTISAILVDTQVDLRDPPLHGPSLWQHRSLFRVRIYAPVWCAVWWKRYKNESHDAMCPCIW